MGLKVGAWKWQRHEYLVQSKVYESEDGSQWDYGPPASPVQVHTATPEDLARFAPKGSADIAARRNERTR